jgi:hypothetical protein
LKEVATGEGDGTRQRSGELFSDLLRNEEVPLDLRFQAAKELAPFVHPKLASVESRTGGKTHEERLEALMKMAEDEDEG